MNISVLCKDFDINKKMNIKIQNLDITNGLQDIETNETGALSLDLRAGTYKITTELYLTPEEYLQLTGETALGNVTYAASVASVNIKPEEIKNIDLNMVMENAGTLVFQEIYFTGSTPPPPAKVKYMYDTYIKLYNNSSEVISLDNVYIGSAYTSSYKYFSDYIEDYAAMKHIFKFPASDGNNILQPGDSIMLAVDGCNHTDPSFGHAWSIDNTNADWEFYINNEKNKDLDYDGVQNMEEVYVNSLPFDFLFVGSPALALFVMQPEEFEAIELKTKQGSSSSTLYALIPNKYIIDSFQARKDKNMDRTSFGSSVNVGFFGGYQYYSGMAARRKVASVEDDGRVVLQNRKNSDEDFVLKKVGKQPDDI
jgi:hypothetical protein